VFIFSVAIKIFQPLSDRFFPSLDFIFLFVSKPPCTPPVFS
jgi:hypothetical protein